MTIRQYPTQERLRELFDYTEATYILGGRFVIGGLVRRFKIDTMGRPNTRDVGAFAGTIRSGDGRVQVHVDGKIYELNRLIWIWHNGTILGSNGVDHKDRDCLNNLIDNFRLATVSENNCNRSKGNGCSSQYKGVYLSKSNKWVAQIKINSKVFYLGSYSTEIEAARACDAGCFLHGSFALLNEV